jgi:glycosyltransferase involved in cell wall biosynthesis
MNPFFSIIIPTYNRAHLISKAIDSVIAQTFENWELIIVDDGSTDNTKELILSYQEKDARIQYLYQENAERSAARNNGIKRAKGQYICFLDSDDYYLKERLKGLYDFIQTEKEPKQFYYTAITYDYNGRLKVRPERMRGKENVFEFIVQAIIGTPQVVLSKDIICKEKFNSKWRIGEDMELWLRLAKIQKPILIENQATVVATEHDERSINVFKYNIGYELLYLYQFIFTYNHSGQFIGNKVKKKLKSDAYFSISKHFIFNKSRIKAIRCLIKAIVTNPCHYQIKFRVNLLKMLVLNVKLYKIESLLFSKNNS